MNEKLFWILVAISATLVFIAPKIKVLSSGFKTLLRNTGSYGLLSLATYYGWQHIDQLKEMSAQLGLTILLCIQIYWISVSFGNKAYIAPIRITLITMTLYGLLAQLTLVWSNYIFNVGPYNQILNVIYLGVFIWLLLESPSGELKGGEIGRLEFSETPFWWEIVISQGKVILPLMFGYEVVERRLAYSMAKSVQIGKGAKGTVGVRIWFKIVRPSTLSEYDVETQVKPEITRLFQSDIIAWARTIDDNTFINSLRVIESIVKNGQDGKSGLNGLAGREVLARFGLQVESIACADPEQSKETDEAQAVIDMMKKLTEGDIDKVTATNMAMAMSGHAELVLMGLAGKGQGKNNKGSVIVDDDDKSKKGGKADSSSEKKDEKKKLSDGPKAPGKGLAVRAVILIWAIHIIIMLLGWGKNSNNTSGVKGSDVSEAIAVAADSFNPNQYLPKRLNQPVLEIPLVDNGQMEWIKSISIDRYGNRLSDDEGWILNDQEGYLRAKVLQLKFGNTSTSNIVEVEAEIESGEIITFSSDKNGWYRHDGDKKNRVYQLTLLQNCKRFRIRVLDPDIKNPLTLTVMRAR